MDLKSKGFTLLEVVAASIILSVGLIPIMKILPAALQVSSKIEVITKCTFLGQRKIEEVRANALTSFDNLNNMELDNYFPSPDERYYFRVDYPLSGDLRTVTVTVWLDKEVNEELDGDENSVVLETKIANRG